MRGIVEEYRTISDRAGWIDRSARGRLRFEGRDAVSFLQALVTNDVARLAPGEGVSCAYLTPQGRMIAEIDIYRRDGFVLAGVADGLGAPLAARFDQLIFAEDVRVADVSEETAEIAVVGGRAGEVLASALSIDAAALGALAELAQIDLADGFVARAGDALLPSYKVIVPAAAKTSIVARLEAQGAASMSERTSDALRIEAGRPIFGVDMTNDTIPLEAGLLDRAISTTKGCYVGQEIIIRILHRGGGRVARRLVTLALDSPAPEAADSAAPRSAGSISIFTDAGKEVGRVTSIAFSPRVGAEIALGYLPRELAEVGVRVRIGQASGPFAQVTGLAR